MFSISFIFKPGTYDDEFRRLDAATQAVAAVAAGYLGSETWWSDDRTGRTGRGERRQATLRHLNVPAPLPLEIEVTGTERWFRTSTA